MARREITWEDVEALGRALEEELPRFAVCYKDESGFQRLLGKLLRPFNRTYMTRYTTVMFGRVYFPSRRWREKIGPLGIWERLRHEAVHLRDQRRFPVLFQVSYLLLLPSVFTMRAVWEWRAYAETLRALAEAEGAIEDKELDEIERRFVGADYLFMFPFRGFVRRRLEALRARVLAELDVSPP